MPNDNILKIKNESYAAPPEHQHIESGPFLGLLWAGFEYKVTNNFFLVSTQSLLLNFVSVLFGCLSAII